MIIPVWFSICRQQPIGLLPALSLNQNPILYLPHYSGKGACCTRIQIDTFLMYSPLSLSTAHRITFLLAPGRPLDVGGRIVLCDVNGARGSVHVGEFVAPAGVFIVYNAGAVEGVCG